MSDAVDDLLPQESTHQNGCYRPLSHASPATTANMYADISFEDMQDGVTGVYD